MSWIHSMGVVLHHIARWLIVNPLIGSPARAQNAQVTAPADRFATLIELNGAIGPVTGSYVVRSFAEAGHQQSAVVVLQIGAIGDFRNRHHRSARHRGHRMAGGPGAP